MSRGKTSRISKGPEFPTNPGTAAFHSISFTPSTLDSLTTHDNVSSIHIATGCDRNSPNSNAFPYLQTVTIFPRVAPGGIWGSGEEGQGGGYSWVGATPGDTDLRRVKCRYGSILTHAPYSVDCRPPSKNGISRPPSRYERSIYQPNHSLRPC
jgi:hypothetical protein